MFFLYVPSDCICMLALCHCFVIWLMKAYCQIVTHKVYIYSVVPLWFSNWFKYFYTLPHLPQPHTQTTPLMLQSLHITHTNSRSDIILFSNSTVFTRRNAIFHCCVHPSIPHKQSAISITWVTANFTRYQPGVFQMRGRNSSEGECQYVLLSSIWLTHQIARGGFQNTRWGEP